MEMKKGSVAGKGDYDCYLIEWKKEMLWKKGRKKIINAELERRHPCFSEKCAVDYRLKFWKRKLFLQTVVMNEEVLKDYRKQNRKILLEEMPGRSVFKRKGKTGIKLLYVVMEIIFSAAVIYFACSTKKGNRIVEREEKGGETIEEAVNQENGSLYERLFEVTEKEGGEIISFFLEEKSNFTELRAKIRGLTPELLLEKFPEAETGNVDYLDGQGEIEIAARDRAQKEKRLSENEKEMVSVLELRKEVRKILVENNVKLLEEGGSSYFLSFEGERENCGKVLKEMNGLMEKGALKVLKLSLQGSGSGNLKIILYFSENRDSGVVDLSKVGENIKLFRGKQKEVILKKESVKNGGEKPAQSRTEKGEGLDEGIKIGKVEHENGKSTVFYKDKNGKLIVKIKEKENEKQN